jgi:hypothetical protein
VKDEDDQALGGLLSRIGGLGQGRLRDEYAAFLADAYSQGPLRALEVLGRLDRQARAEVAEAIVGAAVGLYPGDPADTATPWPTKRAPRDVLSDRYAERAWDALQAAEDELREQRGMASRRVSSR